MTDYDWVLSFLRHLFEIAEYVVVKAFLLVLAVIALLAVIRQHRRPSDRR